MTQRNKGIRYVQGMNVLAAPFLYVCGGEAECMAFGLFERFITVECPVYVRPTLEGVHRGLKVHPLLSDFPVYKNNQLMSSCWIFVFIRLSRNCTVTYGPRIYKPSCMLSLVRPPAIETLLLYQILIIQAVLTFSACTPPLAEVLLLWDFLLAYGIHMNILAIISQLIILRDEILQHPSYVTSLASLHLLHPDSRSLTIDR
jgi:cell cycle arrest protein BUB2